MPASSEAQRRFMGAIVAYKQGKLKNPSKKLKKSAKGISMSDAKDFAGSVQRNRRTLASSI